jgi:hypothetical protein
VTSIYERALGADFVRLHPRVQERFGFSSRDGVACIGHGRMDEIWRGRPYTVPFLVLGTWRRIMFPSYGLDIPFTIENYAYVDSFGRETMTWIRTFEFPQRVRRFDATMIWSDARGCIVDYLGTHQHLAVDLHASVDEEGGIRFRSGEQRFYERRVGFRFPRLFSGIAEVREWYDDAATCFRIQVAVANARFGRLFGYRGRFHAEERPCTAVPAHVRPVREERRE